eukprot:2902066-Rhodomonas_salina.1
MVLNVDPAEDHFCTKVYRSVDEFEALNELSAAHALADFAAETKRFIWCNNASCRLYSQTKENMLAMNFKDCSQAAALNHQLTYESVQVHKKVFETQKTVYPNGKVLTLTITAQPVNLQLDGWDEPQTMCLMTFTPVSESSGDVTKWRAAEEMVRHVSIVSTGSFSDPWRAHHAVPGIDLAYGGTVFDMHTESKAYRQAVYQSPRSLEFYSDFEIADERQPVGTRTTPVLDINAVLDSCCWESASVKREELETSLFGLEIESAALVFSCRKLRQNEVFRLLSHQL